MDRPDQDLDKKDDAWTKYNQYRFYRVNGAALSDEIQENIEGEDLLKYIRDKTTDFSGT